jgi:hypothetical protein
MLKPVDFLNKMILVGITIERENGVKEYIQTHGVCYRIDGDYLFLRRTDNEEFCLGFSIEAFSIAKPGIYKEKSTGIEIENPDYFCKWTTKSTLSKDKILRNGFRDFIKE